MAGTANSITSHNLLRGVLNANNVIAGGVGTAFDSTYSIIAETGAQIALSISSTDYKMQATLKDKYGNVIYTSNIIDLPLETMVVNARYDSNTKEVVLILDNGNELRFSVADLVEGLVSTDQLNSVLTDYVKFTDYATNSKGGVVKANVNGFNIGSTGNPYALELTYANYQQYGGGSFVGKGTLENVIIGKELVNKTYVDEADAVFEDKLFGDNNVEGSGTELTIDNTTEAPMSLVYKGNTSQETTTGNNLFDISKVINSANGSVVNNGDGTLSVKGYGVGGAYPAYLKTYCPTLQVGDEVIFTFNTTSTNKFLYLVGTNQTWISGNTRTITQQDLDSQVLWYGASGSQDVFIISNIMVRKSETSADYEKYTGGITSPNPDYPQEIHVVSGDNSIEVVGKNLLNPAIENNWVSWYIPVKANKPYIYSESGVGANCYFYFYETIGGTGTYTYTIANTPYTPTQNGYVRINKANSTHINLMLEQNSLVTPYEEYKSASYPISLGDIELCKIGTYQDKIDKSSGKNLFDEVFRQGSENNPLNTQNVFSQNNLQLEAGTYTFSTNLPMTSFKYAIGTSSTGFPGSATYIDGFHTTSSFTFTLSQTTYVGIMVNMNNTEMTPSNILSYYFQINKGSTVLPYEPYGTNWYLKKEIGKVVLNGGENWRLYTGTCYFINIPDAKTGYKTSLCTHFTNINLAFDSGVVGRYCDHPTLTNKYFVSNSSSVEDFKTWLSNNNTTLYYILATPIYEEITDETLVNQLEAIKLSYENQTNISQTNNDLPFELNISAVSGNLSGIKLLLEAKEDKSNKVAIINEYSTDEQYPTAKCVYELVGNIESILETLDIGDGVYTGGELE